MYSLKSFLLPEVTDNTILRVNQSYLDASVNLRSNFYYQVLDETTLDDKELISLQILITVDKTGEYFLIVNESSDVNRWKSIEDMQNYLDMRVAELEKRKSNIMVMSPIMTDQHFLIQYYVYAGKSELKHISALVKKIIKQVDDFRDNYNNKNA